MAKKTRPAAKDQKPRQSDEERRAAGYSPFMRPEHTADGATWALTGWNRPSPDGTQFFVEVADENGVTYDLGVRKFSPDHRELVKGLGNDFEKWKGSIVVTIKAGKEPGKSFVNVASASPEDAPF